jgi:hypothetical protein
MPFRIEFLDKQIGRRYRAASKRDYDRAARAVTSAAHEAARELLRLGRADISGAGNFGTRWTRGLRADVTPPRGSFSVDAQILVRHDLTAVGFRLFEFGGVVRGRPLLWIPLSFAADARGVRARDYPGPLFRVDRRSGAPLLLTTGGEPKYFGKESVTMPRKFHIRDVGRRVARGFEALYRKYFRLYRSS